MLKVWPTEIAADIRKNNHSGYVEEEEDKVPVPAEEEAQPEVEVEVEITITITTSTEIATTIIPTEITTIEMKTGITIET